MSRTKRSRNTKFVRLYPYGHQFQGQRSRSPCRLFLTVDTGSASYLLKGKAIQTWNLVHRWSTKTRIADKRHDHEGQGIAMSSEASPISRNEKFRNIKNGRKVVHPTSNNAHQFQGQKFKNQGDRLTNAKSGSASYLANWKAYELQTWYTVGTWRAASRAVAYHDLQFPKSKMVTTDEVMWSVWQVLAHRTKSSRNSKIGRYVVHATNFIWPQLMGNHLHVYG